MTFSGVQLLVWCAAVPAIMFLSRKWIAAIFTIGIAIVLGNTRGVWLGAAAGFAFVAFALPRRVVATIVIPMLVVAALASPFIYRRIRDELRQGPGHELFAGRVPGGRSGNDQGPSALRRRAGAGQGGVPEVLHG